MKPHVSIITPTFNLQKYIGFCIDSVIKQTFIDWEMIIIDDGSTDNTVPIIKHYTKKDSRIRFILHKKNWGVGKLRDTYNQALSIAKGKYIAILEGDDFWPNYKLERQVKSLQEKSVILSYGDSVFTDGSGKPFDILFYRQQKDKLNNYPVGSIIGLFSDFDFYLSPVTVVIKKDALIKIGGFQNGPHYYFVDFPTWLRLALEGQFIYERVILGYYRRHKKSVWLDFARKSKNMTRQEMQCTFIDFFNKNNKLLQSKGIHLKPSEFLKRQNRFILKKSENRDASFLLHSLAYGDKDEIMKNIKVILMESGVKRKIKLFAFASFFLIPIRKQLMSFLFQIKNEYYKITVRSNA